MPSAGGAAASLQAELTQVGARVEAAYATFATSVRQAELTLLPASAGAAPTGTLATVSLQMAQQLATLQAGITSALQGRALGNLPGLLQQELTGASSGSLSTGLTQILDVEAAGSAGGPVPASSLPVLFTAVDGVMAASFNSTSIQLYLAATGQSSTGATSGSSFSVGQYGGQVNAAYAAFATGVRQAEVALVNPGGPSAPVGVAATLGPQIQALARSVTASLAGTSAAADSGVIQGQFLGETTGALASELSALLVASTAGSADGSALPTSLPLLFAAGESAINVSYSASATDGVLLASVVHPASTTSAVPAGDYNGATTIDFDSFGVFFAK